MVLLKEEVRQAMCCNKDVGDHMHQQGSVEIDGNLKWEGYNL